MSRIHFTRFKNSVIDAFFFIGGYSDRGPGGRREPVFREFLTTSALRICFPALYPIHPVLSDGTLSKSIRVRAGPFHCISKFFRKWEKI
jgi:hypothetical protein